MKGYIVKYSTYLYDEYRVHDVKVFLDRKEAERYMEKFNRVISKAKDFYRDGCKDYHSVSLEEYNTKTEYWDNVYDKFEFYNDISEPWIEEIEIVEEIKLDKSRWD